MATCRKCGKNPAKDRVCLARVNEIGVLPAIWECRPSCDAKLSAEECVLLAIEGDSGRGVRRDLATPPEPERARAFWCLPPAPFLRRSDDGSSDYEL